MVGQGGGGRAAITTEVKTGEFSAIQETESHHLEGDHMADPVHNAKGGEGQLHHLYHGQGGARHAQGVMERADLIDIL